MTSSDWLNSANWSSCNSVVPTSTDDVTLPGGNLLHEPSLTTGSASINSLTTALTRTLTLGAGRVLTLSTSLNNSGIIAGAGTLRTNGTTYLTQNGALFAPLEVAGGTATAATATYSGTVTVDSGAVLRPDCTHLVTVRGSLTVNGTLAYYCNDTFDFTRPLVTNNGSVSVYNFTFGLTGTQAIASGGAWTDSYLTIGAGSTTVQSSDVSLAVPAFTVDGTFNGAAYTLTIDGGVVMYGSGTRAFHGLAISPGSTLNANSQ